MKKLSSTTVMMMEMCMQACSICVISHAIVSDMFSIKAKHFAA